MNYPNPQFVVKSLNNIAFDKLCHSMSEELMIRILNEYPPILVLQVVWKVRHICILLE